MLPLQLLTNHIFYFSGSLDYSHELDNFTIANKRASTAVQYSSPPQAYDMYASDK